MEKKMNVLLSDLVVFYHKLQSYHWYVKGCAFFQAHAKLEEYYDAINEQIDEVAETALMAGFKPVSRVADFMALTKIKEASGDYVEPCEIFTEVLKDFRSLLKSVEEIKAEADKADNYLISAKMDEFIAAYRKNIWMISQSQM